MPLYSYTCDSCGRQIDAFRPIDDRNRPENCECGGVATKVAFPKSQSINPDLEPYYDESLCEPGGHGNWCLSRRQQRDMMKRFHLANKRSYVGDF